DDLVLLFLAEHVLDDANLNEGHRFLRLVLKGSGRTARRALLVFCLTRASLCRTLAMTVRDSFAVTEHACTGQATGPLQRGGKSACCPLPSARAAASPFAIRLSLASNDRSTIGICGPAPSCHRSAILPKRTALAASRWSRRTTVWSQWAIYIRAAAPASTQPRRPRLRRPRIPHPLTITSATSSWSGLSVDCWRPTKA